MAPKWLRGGGGGFFQKETRQLAGGFRFCSKAIFDCAVPLSGMATTDITDYA
ncbi:hypothetical protein AAH211_01160 [Serratia fonticola]|uniref:hypothetical protein n=1 Tax=Serratia fonticola TaxID=47917 RepID=UPI0039873F75